MDKSKMHGFPADKHSAAVTKAVSQTNKLYRTPSAADKAEDKRDHGRDESREKT
jgi:hypothetical protein